MSQQDSHVPMIAQESHVIPQQMTNQSCLQLRTPIPILTSTIVSVVSHPCFHTKEISLHPMFSVDQGTRNRSLDEPIVPRNKFTNLKTLDSDSTSGLVIKGNNRSDRHFSMLYFLQWNLSHEESIRFYHIFWIDRSGMEHFIGSSVTSCYIFKQSCDSAEDMHPVKFVIQPIPRNTTALGEKFDVNIQLKYEVE